MFGSSNQNPAPADNTQPGNPANPSGLNSFTMDPPKKEPTASPVADAPSAPHVDENAAASNPAPAAPAAPADLPVPPLPPAPTESPSTLADLEASVHGEPAPAAPVSQEEPAAPVTSVDNSELLAIKTQALTQLSPLISHLDQTPEDKFKTLMMMIQANDNQGLIKEAYEAAQQITDEKAKSQALLDIVNEINYFTQKQK